MKNTIVYISIFIILTSILAPSILSSSPSQENTTTIFQKNKTNLFTPLFSKIAKKIPIFSHHTILQPRFLDPHWFSFSPQPITLQDDAFHNADTNHFSEWWYFDAKLDQGYTMQIIIQVLSMLDWNMVSTKFNLYKDGELKTHTEDFTSPINSMPHQKHQ